MKSSGKTIHKFLFYTVLCLFLPGMCNHVLSQQIIGLSYGYEVFPHVKLVDPLVQSPDFEIQASSWSVGAAFPLVFGQGKTIVMNQFNYKRTDLNYHNLPENSTDIEQMQSIH